MESMQNTRGRYNQRYRRREVVTVGWRLEGHVCDLAREPHLHSGATEPTALLNYIQFDNKNSFKVNAYYQSRLCDLCS